MTPREPDRFDKAALEIWGGDFTPAGFAAALRAEHASALERAFTRINALIAEFGQNPESALSIVSGYVDEALHGILRDRALIPPAAAPAAETGKAQHKADCPATHHDPFREDLCTCRPAQGALDELAAVIRGKDAMGEKLAKALGVPAGPLGRLVDAAIARLAELEKALEKATIQIGILLDRMRGCDDEIKQGRRDKDGHALSLFEGTAWIAEHRAKLAARAAPSDRKGK